MIVLGTIAWAVGFNIFKFLAYIKEEILLVLATSSSDPVLPTLMEKLENLGCSKALVGLVVPTGYSFNADGSSLYMTMAALFVAQATNTPLTLGQQLTIFAVATIPGAILGAVSTAYVPRYAFDIIFGVLMIVAGAFLWLSAKDDHKQAHASPASPPPTMTASACITAELSAMRCTIEIPFDASPHE